MAKIVKTLLLIGLFYYLLKDLNSEKIYDSFVEYSLLWSIIAMVSVLLSDLILAKRWSSLSKGRFSLLASFEAIGVSAFLNFILPAKLGELSKVVYLKKIYNFDTRDTFSILILERVFDVLFLGFFSIVAVVFFLDNSAVLESASIFIFLVVVFFILVKSKKFRRVLKKIKIKAIRVNLLKIVSNLSKASDKKTMIRAIFYTSMVWVSYFLTVYIFLVFIGEFNLAFFDIFTVFVISSIAMSLPLLPGGVGAYQAGIVFALGLYGIPKEEALIAGVMLHIFMLIPSFMVAIYIFNSKDISINIFKRE